MATFFAVGVLLALSASSGAAVTGEPAVTTGCAPGTRLDFHIEVSWPSAVAKPAGLTFHEFRCVIQDSTTIDAFTIGNAATAALQSGVGGATSGPLTTANTTGLESTTALPSTASAGGADFVSANVSVTMQGKVANPEMRCFGGVHPSPDWFLGASVPDLCSLPHTAVSRNITLHDLGIKDGATFAASTAATSPVGTVQPATAFPQVFGTLVIRRRVASAECRQAGRVFSWFARGTWPGVPQPTGATVTGFICVAHTTKFALWQPLKLASAAMKSLAETGSTTAIEAQLEKNAEVLFWRKFANLTFSGTTLVSEVVLPANMPNYPVYSCAGKVSPSPDWFVGVDSAPMCDHLTPETRVPKLLALLDAGTDNGTSWTAGDSPRTVPLPINLAPSTHTGIFLDLRTSFSPPSSEPSSGSPAATIATFVSVLASIMLLLSSTL